MAPWPSHVIWDPVASTAIYERQVQIVRAAGALAELPIYVSSLALDRIWNGDLADAAALIAETEDVSAATGSQLPPMAALRLAATRGRESEAAPLIEATIALGDARGQGLAVRIAQFAAATLYNGLARYHDAFSAAHQASPSDMDPYPLTWILIELIEAATRIGEADVAQIALERLANETIPAGTDWALGTEARSRALVLEGDAAEHAYREAIERFSRTSLRTEVARAHLIYGEWLRREGRRVDAREHLRTAYELFVGIGMEAFAERARRELNATGEKVRKRSPETTDELTPQEAQIARLARDGFSNPEIGAQLFISSRTVEWHLRKVFTKLEITSRRQLRTALPDEDRGAKGA
jgi:DNA-binding CsgD family transcriptional regulator